MMTSFIKVRWIHSDERDPILLYSELDEERWETRKVEIYADGRADFADAEHETGTTGLGEVPMPSLEHLAADPQYEPREITAEEFEAIWHKTTAGRL